ncbi:MAG TPA: trehalose-6-phosphate synthase [Pseudolabrys sp.]|nr:trehalose-6-phosphate synthase [Pseudolabrys sp.]
MDIVVSNRVARITPGGPMVGGLASALLPAVKKSGVVWFGSSGNLRKIEPGDAPLVEVESYGRGTIARVDLPEQQYSGFYEGYANSCLWPLLHSRADLAHGRAEEYASYCAVNAYMARTLASFAPPDATLWIHDYHFLPLGRELRRLGIGDKIGFFLHTPWPSRRTMAHLTQHRELVEAMLAYDLIGFQTDRDRDNFAAILRHELHIPCNGMSFDGPYGTCRLATFPIGIDTEEFADSAMKAANDPAVHRLRTSLNGAKLIVGVDRIDYSKGLGQRLQAFDHLLNRYPGLAGRLTYLQVAVPSRSSITTYRALQRQLAAQVGDINGRHGDIDWTPVRYLNKGYCQATLAGFYRTAAVGLVTPLQDGMNLVAKEYVAAQNPSDPGVLVLSKFAGAARELDGALMVDPQDVEGIARRITNALVMPLDERRARWQQMMDTLLRRSIHSWFSEFLQALKLPENDNVIPLEPAKALPLRTAVRDSAWAAYP